MFNYKKLTNQKAFTLIELLVVIAIISILVVIVIVAINPVKRLQNATDRQAAANVRATGTLISTCVSKQLAQDPPGDIMLCVPASPGSTTATATLNTYGTAAAGVWMSSNVALDDVCAAQQGNNDATTGHYYVYTNSSGTTTEFTAAALPAATVWCP